MFAKLYYYQNFTISAGFSSLQVLVWGIFGGILLGAILSTIDKVYCGRMIQALWEAGAQDANGARTLDSLEIRGKWYLRRALREGKPLRKMLLTSAAGSAPAVSVGEEPGEKPLSGGKKTGFGRKASPKIQENPGQIPFYLTEEKHSLAENRYRTSRRPFMDLILITLALLATVFFVLFIVPELLTMLDNLIGFIKYGE